MEVAEHDPDRQRGGRADPEGCARKLELLERLRGEKAGVVADEPERLEERVRVGSVEDQRTHRTSVLRAVTSTRSSESASATTSTPAE